jgi:hypothetical protein
MGKCVGTSTTRHRVIMHVILPDDAAFSWGRHGYVCSTYLSQQKIFGLNAPLTEDAERRDCTDASISQSSSEYPRLLLYIGLDP